MWIDSHCHVTADEFAEVRDAVLARAFEGGVDLLVAIGAGYGIDHNRRAIELAARDPRIFAAVGVHPHDARLLDDPARERIRDWLAADRVVAVGECGLDYHYDHSPRDTQREVFAAQIGLAHEHGLPLVIHTREAWEDTFSVLDSEGTPEHTVFHCFTGGPDEAERGLARGAHVSFSGIVTFKNAHELREALVRCPLDRVMVETDSPYLTPEPMRGRRNSPANLPLVAARMAEELGVALEAMAEQLWQTTVAFYGLPD